VVFSFDQNNLWKVLQVVTGCDQQSDSSMGCEFVSRGLESRFFEQRKTNKIELQKNRRESFARHV